MPWREYSNTFFKLLNNPLSLTRWVLLSPAHLKISPKNRAQWKIHPEIYFQSEKNTSNPHSRWKKKSKFKAEPPSQRFIKLRTNRIRNFQS